MIEQLISLISGFWRQILPIVVIDEFEEAVCLRLGRFKKTMGPGPHWKIPFVDDVISEVVVTNTFNLPPQAITTLDNKEIIVSAVVKYQIDDIKKFTLDIMDEDAAIQDICMGNIRAALTSKTWVECQEKTIDTYITNKVRPEVSKYGLDVEKVRLTDMTRVRAFRIFGGMGILSLLLTVWLSINSGYDYIFKSAYYSPSITWEHKGWSISGGGYFDKYGTAPFIDLQYNFRLIE